MKYGNVPICGDICVGSLEENIQLEIHLILIEGLTCARRYVQALYTISFNHHRT